MESEDVEEAGSAGESARSVLNRGSRILIHLPYPIIFDTPPPLPEKALMFSTVPHSSLSRFHQWFSASKLPLARSRLTRTKTFQVSRRRIAL